MDNTAAFTHAYTKYMQMLQIITIMLKSTKITQQRI